MKERRPPELANTIRLRDLAAAGDRLAWLELPDGTLTRVISLADIPPAELDAIGNDLDADMADALIARTLPDASPESLRALSPLERLTVLALGYAVQLSRVSAAMTTARKPFVTQGPVS